MMSLENLSLGTVPIGWGTFRASDVDRQSVAQAEQFRT